MKPLMTEPAETHVLVSKARDGDRSAFEELVERFRARLSAFVQARLELRIGAKLDVEEVLQETFVRGYESIGRFEGQTDGSFFGWLCGIAKHVVLKAARKARHSQPLEEARGTPTDTASPSKLLRRNERFDRLQESLDSLKPEYREVLRLARIEGLKIKEIAERMDRSPNSVKHLIVRALAELKARFGDTESLHLPERRFSHEGNSHGA